MATARQVLQSIVQEIENVVNPPIIDPTSGNPITTSVGVGWPPVSAIQKIGASQQVAMAVYDRSKSRDNTRWMPNYSLQQQQPTFITSTLSNSAIHASPGAVTLTVGLSSPNTAPNANDAISCVLNIGQTWGAQVYSSVAGDTTATIATNLAAQINADPIMSTLVTATAAGSVITLVNKTVDQLKVMSYVGNVELRQLEYSRINRHVQIVMWCGSESVREAIGAVIESMLGALRAKFGVLMSDGTWTWVQYVGDELVEEETLKNIYRRDIYIDVEYSVTSADNAYAVLAPIPTISSSY